MLIVIFLRKPAMTQAISYPDSQPWLVRAPNAYSGGREIETPCVDINLWCSDSIEERFVILYW
jgi:hypothetical protein